MYESILIIVKKYSIRLVVLIIILCSNCRQPISHTEKALQYYDSQHYQDAAEQFDIALTKENNSKILDPCAYLFFAGNAHYFIKNYKKAEVYFQRCIEIDSLNIFGYIGIGKIYRETGDEKEAVRFMKKAYALDNRNSYAAVNLVFTYLCINDYESAISLLINHEKKKNMNGIHWLSGEAYIMQGNYKEAYKSLEKYIYSDKSLNPMVFADLAILHTLTGNRDIAHSKIESAIFLIPLRHKNIFYYIKCAIQSDVEKDSLVDLMLKKNKIVF